MTDNRETPAATGSQRDVPSRSTTKRISRAKSATAVETKDSTVKAPARKRTSGDTAARRTAKIEATDAAPTARADSKKTSTRSKTGKPASAAAKPAVATTADTLRGNSPTRQQPGNEARATTQRDISPAERRDMIRRIAYFRAEWRGWTPGAELDDWLHAEREVDAMLHGDHSA